MTTMIPQPTSPAEGPPEQQVLSLARPLAVLFGAAVVVSAGIGWGRAGITAAGVGTGLSLANVWVLHRLGARATRQAITRGADDAGQATQAAVGLQGALAAKTIVLLAVVALLANRGSMAHAATPFALGLLVTVFALLAAGLLAPLTGRFHRGSPPGIAPVLSQPIS
jgi:hypothetical protein